MAKSGLAGLGHDRLVLGDGGVVEVELELLAVDAARGVAPLDEGLGGVEDLLVEAGAALEAGVGHGAQGDGVLGDALDLVGPGVGDGARRPRSGRTPRPGHRSHRGPRGGLGGGLDPPAEATGGVRTPVTRAVPARSRTMTATTRTVRVAPSIDRSGRDDAGDTNHALILRHRRHRRRAQRPVGGSTWGGRRSGRSAQGDARGAAQGEDLLEALDQALVEPLGRGRRRRRRW